MDGNFGLVHKKSSGEGYRERSMTSFFAKNEEVQQFVMNYKLDKKNNKVGISNYYC